MTIERVFEEAEVPLTEDTKARFLSINIKTDSTRSFNNLIRMVTGSQKDRAIKMIEENVFIDQATKDMMTCTLLSALETFVPN